jgi:hypothetical protein
MNVKEILAGLGGLLIMVVLLLVGITIGVPEGYSSKRACPTGVNEIDWPTNGPTAQLANFCLSGCFSKPLAVV